MPGLDYTQVFSNDYCEARQKFTDAACEVGGNVTSYIHPDRSGLHGETLSVDVARIGDPTASRQLVVISGTHGLEGLSGSASQIAWLRTGQASQLPEGVSALLIHALNPWGFSHGSRTTENNVDLNRNFVDHAVPYPQNPGFSSFVDAMLPEIWGPESLERLDRAIGSFADKHGKDAQFDALTRGQYDHPQAINFGGTDREWSNVALEGIVLTHLEDAQRIALIDWHTGIGDWAQSFFLCFNTEGTPEADLAASWWGREKIRAQRPLGLQRPNYQGLVFNGMRQFLGDRPMVGAVVEFGTRANEMRRALQLDIWLKFRAKNQDPARLRMLRTELADAFVPFSSSWRESTAIQASYITDQAVRGLARW